MYFLIQRSLQNGIIIEVHSAEELKFQVSTYGEFLDEDMERIFNEKRRNMDSRVFGNDDKDVMIYRLLKKELKHVSLNICKVCAEKGETRYISDGSICDMHIMEKYDLYQYTTYDTADCWGMVELLPADEVVKVLRNLEENNA